MKVLIVEDEKKVVNFLRHGLEAMLFTVDVAYNGKNGSYLALTGEYDIIVLDNMLPCKSGKEVVTEIRKAGKTVPIIMISALSEVQTKVDLFNAGVDDYVTKPFSLDELVARIRALERRPTHLIGDILTIDNLALDTRRSRVTRSNDTPIYLTRKEFALLEYFLRNQESVLSRGMILEHVWDMNTDPFSNTIESHILSLRRKIESPKWKKLIHTVPGRGYKMEALK